MFEGYAMLLLADMQMFKVSHLLRCNEKSLARIMRYWVNKAVDEDDLCRVTSISIRQYKEEILNIFGSKLTNAICKGINSMIQAAKRKAHGYHTVESYTCMIYLLAAKLQLACPNPLR